MSYDEHLISMAGGDGDSAVDQLAAIEARLTNDEAEYGTGYEWEQSFLDRRALLALVREQRAKLDRVEALAERFQAAQSSDIAKRENAQFDLGYSAGRRAAGSILRAAITATEEGK